MKNPALLLLLAMVILGVGGLFLIRQSREGSTAKPTISSPTIRQTSPTVKEPNTDELELGGSSYLDPGGVYSFLYPSDYKLDQQNEGQQTRIFKTGETQKGQTEIYDGVIMVFEVFSLQGMSLEQWVDQKIIDTVADGTSELIEEKTPTLINKYPGFSYKIRGLGESQLYAFQKDPASENVVLVSTLVADPQNVGFQGQVDSVLATLELLK